MLKILFCVENAEPCPPRSETRVSEIYCEKTSPQSLIKLTQDMTI